jgi:hypothetical protein
MEPILDPKTKDMMHLEVVHRQLTILRKFVLIVVALKLTE